jgi:DNA-binding XRE family transcriptional regulator
MSIERGILEKRAVPAILRKMAHPESKEAIAARLEVTRIALGFATQAALSKAISAGNGLRITPQRWNNYESGRDRLTLNLALLICRKFPQVTLDWLYRGDKGTLRPAFSAAIDESERMVKRLSR